MTDMKRGPAVREAPPTISHRQAADQCDRSAAWLLRRRHAALRCVPLADGRRDPLDPPRVERWTARERAAWASAAVHLRRHGLEPVVPDSVTRACGSCRCGVAS